MTITGHLVSGSLAAFGFARLRFPGRNALFMLLLSTLIIPFYAYMIPRFVIIRALGLYDTLMAVVLPYMFGGPFYIFLMRQYFTSLPMELDDAARIDGCSTFGIYWRILLPLARPALATVAVLEFIAAWKSFLEPLIYLSNQNNYTVALGLTLIPIRLRRPGSVGAADGGHNPQRATTPDRLLRDAKASCRRDRRHRTEGLARVIADCRLQIADCDEQSVLATLIDQTKDERRRTKVRNAGVGRWSFVLRPSNAYRGHFAP